MSTWADKRPSLSAFSAEKIVKLVTKYSEGDPTLAKLFLDELIDLAGNKNALVSPIVSLVNAFAWSDIADSLSNALTRLASRRAFDLHFVLKLADAVEASNSESYPEMLLLIVRMATSMLIDLLTETSKDLQAFWKLMICCEGDLEAFV